MKTAFRSLCLGLCFSFASVGGSMAQEAATTSGIVRSPVLVIDTEQVFSQTLYGRRLIEEIEAETQALQAENDKIADALVEEEKSLAARRSTMTPEAFRVEADAFDEKVEGIRRARNAKEAALQQDLLNQRSSFDAQIRPILGELMREREAAVVFPRRDVILYLSAVDVTEAAIAAIDDRLGDGSTAAE